MRSGTRLAALAALALAGCGNYSTEDLRFLSALPRRDDLRVEVPAQGEPGALVGPCATRTADVWLGGKRTSDGLNAGVEFLLALVDAVRRHPPTWREDDARGWGPFDDRNHPGREIQIRMSRSFPDGSDRPAVYAYVFEARVEGTEVFRTILSGTFVGGSASRGRGQILLDFDALWALGMNDADTPRGAMQVVYDRASDPVTIDLALGADGFGVVPFVYGYAGYADRRGTFDYRLRDAGNLLTVATAFDATGAGRARVGFVGAGGGTGSFDQCWDRDACLVYVRDPGNYSCAAAEAPCSLGAITDCPAVPAPPF